MLSLTLATFRVDKKVQEGRKYGMSDRSVFESEREEDDFQPTKKCRTKLSLSKGKQSSKLKHCCWKNILKRYVLKIPTTQWAVSMYNGLCWARNQRSAVLKPKTESMNTSVKALDQSMVED